STDHPDVNELWTYSVTWSFRPIRSSYSAWERSRRNPGVRAVDGIAEARRRERRPEGAARRAASEAGVQFVEHGLGHVRRILRPERRHLGGIVRGVADPHVVGV